MRTPKEREIWILNNERFDPETGMQMPAIDLSVRVERVDPAHVRKSIDQETGEESSIRIPDRIHFRYCEDTTNKGLGLQHESGKMRVGSYDLASFVERARPSD